MVYVALGFMGVSALFVMSACKLSSECARVEESLEYNEEKTR